MYQPQFGGGGSSEQTIDISYLDLWNRQTKFDLTSAFDEMWRRPRIDFYVSYFGARCTLAWRGAAYDGDVTKDTHKNDPQRY